MRQTSSQALQKTNSNTLLAMYPDRETFFKAFTPDKQIRLREDIDKCFFGDAPSLSVLNATYGRQTAAMWLIPQLYNLSEYCGCRDKLQGNPLKECASIIASEFWFLTVTEIMLFFVRFKSGRYGRFYGSVDPFVIMTALRSFLDERAAAIERHEDEQREQAFVEWRENATSWEDYCIQKYGKLKGLGE